MKAKSVNRTVEQIYDIRNQILDIAVSRGLNQEFLKNVISVVDELIKNPNRKTPKFIPISSSMLTDKPPTVITI